MYQWIFFSVEFNIPTDTPGDGSVPAVQGHSKKRIFGRKYIAEIPRSTLFIADMVKRRAFGELAGSVEAILTLFFLPKNLLVRWIDKWLQQLMIRKVDGEDFETPISEQGSGARSLACLVVDLVMIKLSW